MSKFEHIFVVEGWHETEKKHLFDKVFKTLKGAHSDLDRLKKSVVENLGWKIICDMWRCYDPEQNITSYGFLKVLDRNGNEIWYHIKRDIIYP